MVRVPVRDDVKDDVGSAAKQKMHTNSTQRILHRSPRPLEIDPVRPQREDSPARPERAAPPAWNTVITGIVTGIAVASLSGHWYFAMFSVVTGAVSGASWLVRIAQHRRRMKAWHSNVVRIEANFMEACKACARELAERRRSQHPTMKDIGIEIRMGARWFWNARHLDQVSIGCGRRAISVVDGAPMVAIDEVPILVDMSPGQMIGIHGRRASAVLRALVVRMAARVGPSDWRLVIVGDTDGAWRMLQSLPHFTAASTSDIEHGHVVIVVFDATVVQRHSPVMRRFDEGSTSVIVVAENRQGLPAACTSIVDSEDEEVEGLALPTFVELCRSICAWADPDLDGSALPVEVDFVDVLGGGGTTVNDVIETWRRRRGLGPRVDLGRNAEGVVQLELDRDGPHAVIVGTTGSGKSEVLRQFVMSMAWNSSPADVSFLLVDYKGGSAFDACAELPHVVGVITDLDVGMAERVLLGLEAELSRRELILRNAAVGDVLEFQRLCVGASDEQTLPRLVVVIDELAALRREAPEFVPALAAIAQRGRSLGLHLIAATQRSAALGADVLANSSLRIALRVQTVGDSVDVIGTDRAAHLDRSCPGRLVVKIGSDAPVEVQAARVTESLCAIGALVFRACAEEPMPQPHRPYVEPLPEKITRTSADSGIIGIVDDVVHQRQQDFHLVIEQHIMIIARVGRSNALRVIIASLGCLHPEIDVVVVACRPSRLDGFSQFGVVIDLADSERMERALRLCESRIATANSNRANDHMTNQMTHRRLLLVIDDIDVWYAQTSSNRVASHLWEIFDRILAAGSSKTVVCAMTSMREQGVPTAILARAGSTWIGTERTGTFRIRTRNDSAHADVQLFWEEPRLDEHDRSSVSADAELECELERLPTTLKGELGSFAIRADTRTAVSIGSGDLVRFLVLGAPGSGVSTALAALSRSWTASHPTGRVVQLPGAADMVDSSQQTDQQWIDSLRDGEPTLIVVDDLQRHSSQLSVVSRIFDDPARWGRVSIVVGTSAAFVRARPEHWIHQIRRSRTGVLLGRSIDEDADLFGLHAPHVNVYASAPGRGLWVDGGVNMGIVHVVVDVAR